MSFFHSNPFIKIVSVALLGIIAANQIPESIFGFCLLLFILALLLFKQAVDKRPFYDFVSSAFLLTAILVLFMIHVRSKHHTDLEKLNGTQTFSAIVLEKPTEKANSYQCIIQICQTSPVCLCNQKLLAYLGKSELTKGLRAGDLIVAEANIREIGNSANPYGFDYKSYMARQKIYYSAFIKSSDIYKSGTSSFSLLTATERFRGYLLSSLKSQLKHQQSFEVISALTLGYRKELSPETRTYFSATGSMHVLAVSGLHVGMIFMFLSRIFSFLKRSAAGRWFNFFVIASFLWAYALLTGLSPSVLRATVMFSFILAGTNLNRPTPIYNSIAASAFFLLFINPNLLFEVGFQLSYLAVISIVFFYPKFEKLTNPKHLRWVWQLLCVSVAAQIGVLPLTIFYFNQFPVFFWLSNFIVVPAAYVILSFTFAFFVFSSVTMISQGLIWILEGVTTSVLFLLRLISQFPYALIEEIRISAVQVLSLVVMYGFGMFFIKFKNHIFLFLCLFACFVFQLSGFVERSTVFNQQKLIVYESNRPLIHLINGRTNYLLCHAENLPDPYLYEPVLLKLHLDPPELIRLNTESKTKSEDLICETGYIQFIRHSFILDRENKETTPVNRDTTIINGMIDLHRIKQSTIRLKLR
ncbi:ComEC/Rec2 family competence protein [Gaoshiqia sp. Z1-71]|uniref:ComEC/Rec2 family competence protein n=1 Tax=Gaoshiqia hydrogeniformans TaxID=3290090 RepID=UPI003BF872C3